VAPDGFFKLRAEDAADLAVISACVQDALVAVRDLTYDRPARRFVVVANRFRREATAGAPPPFERTLCAVVFNGVDGVAYRGFRRRDDGRILSLLAIRAGSGTINLDFSGGAAVRLTSPAVRCLATDIGEPWPTQWHPDHPDDAP
jgi:hypothetical protein